MDGSMQQRHFPLPYFPCFTTINDLHDKGVKAVHTTQNTINNMYKKWAAAALMVIASSLSLQAIGGDASPVFFTNYSASPITFYFTQDSRYGCTRIYTTYASSKIHTELTSSNPKRFRLSAYGTAGSVVTLYLQCGCSQGSNGTLYVNWSRDSDNAPHQAILYTAKDTDLVQGDGTCYGGVSGDPNKGTGFANNIDISDRSTFIPNVCNLDTCSHVFYFALNDKPF